MVNKTVLITGASRGIGAEFAKIFAKNGYNIAFCYNKSKDMALKLKTELEKEGVKVLCEKADVGNLEELKTFIDNAFIAFKKIDVLINNAGVALSKLLIDCDESDYERIFNINVKGTIFASKYILPNMLSNGSGKIINIASVWGEIGASMEVLYSASKSAIIGFTKALSKEYGRMNISVNAISPGFIETDMNENLNADEISAYKESLSLNKLGKTMDISKLALFLAEESSFITGQVFSVNGGAY